MRIFSKLSNTLNTIVKKYKRATPKQLVLTGVFMLVFAGAIAGGLASRSTSSAYACDPNNIMYCGASSKSSFINQVRNGDGRNSDLKAVYAAFGLKTESDYNDFVANAKSGVMNRQGEIFVDGQKVATNGLSMGRYNFGGNKAKNIGGKTYYYDTPSKRWASGVNTMDVMVWFDENGTVITAIMNACGNPVPDMKRVESSGKCTGIKERKTDKNTYKVSAVQPEIKGLAKIKGFNYYVDGKFLASTSKASDEVTIKLTKTSTVEVRVVLSLPGGKTKEVTASICKKVLKFEEEKFTYVCKNLYFTTKDNRTFRFFVAPEVSANVKAISADFELDGDTMAKNVTKKNGKGEFYTDYTFKDEKTHTVKAFINVEYTKDGKKMTDRTKVTSKCTEKVKPKQPPVCEYDPKLPPDDPKCKPPVKECKPGIPEGDERCETCEDNPGKEGCELPNTGPAGVAALFAGVTAAGTIGHRLFASYRNRR
jgi:hypothetical protein